MTVKKAFAIIIVIFSVVNIFKLNYSYADVSISNDISEFKANISENTAAQTYDLRTIVNKFLGVLRVLSGLILVIVVATTGYNYIVATPQIRTEVKKQMLPIILGLALVFGAVAISQFILSELGG